jgi:hypothetical protein
MVNMLFWFIATPSDFRDTIKTIVTSMAAVLTTTMTLRIILSVRGSLAHGGSFAGSSTAAASAGSRGTTHVISTRATNPGAGNAPGVLNINSQIDSQHGPQTFTLGEMGATADKPRGGAEWSADDKSSVGEGKEGAGIGMVPSDDDVNAVVEPRGGQGGYGVKITIDREVS